MKTKKTKKHGKNPWHGEIERLRTLLRRYVEESGVDREEIAKRVGIRAASLADLLKKDGTLPEMEKVLQILDAIGITPKTFYADLYNFEALVLELRLAALTDVTVAKGLLTRQEIDDAYAGQIQNLKTSGRRPLGR